MLKLHKGQQLPAPQTTALDLQWSCLWIRFCRMLCNEQPTGLGKGKNRILALTLKKDYLVQQTHLCTPPCKQSYDEFTLLFLKWYGVQGRRTLVSGNDSAHFFIGSAYFSWFSVFINFYKIKTVKCTRKNNNVVINISLSVMLLLFQNY